MSQFTGSNVPALEKIVPPRKYPYTVILSGSHFFLLDRSNDISGLRFSENVLHSSTVLIDPLFTSYRVKSSDLLGAAILEDRNTDLLLRENRDLRHLAELLCTILRLGELHPRRIDEVPISVLLLQEVQREPLVALNTVANSHARDGKHIRRLLILSVGKLTEFTLHALTLGLKGVKLRELIENPRKASSEPLMSFHSTSSTGLTLAWKNSGIAPLISTLAAIKIVFNFIV